jgi:hypothetical protein
MNLLTKGAMQAIDGCIFFLTSHLYGASSFKAARRMRAIKFAP